MTTANVEQRYTHDAITTDYYYNGRRQLIHLRNTTTEGDKHWTTMHANLEEYLILFRLTAEAEWKCAPTEFVCAGE